MYTLFCYKCDQDCMAAAPSISVSPSTACATWKANMLRGRHEPGCSGTVHSSADHTMGTHASKEGLVCTDSQKANTAAVDAKARCFGQSIDHWYRRHNRFAAVKMQSPNTLVGAQPRHALALAPASGVSRLKSTQWSSHSDRR